MSLLLAPPVDVHANTSGLMAWFTPAHIGALVAIALVVIFVIRFLRMLLSHPVILVVLVLLVGIMAGWIAVTPPQAPGHQPFVPATGPPIPR